MIENICKFYNILAWFSKKSMLGVKDNFLLISRQGKMLQFNQIVRQENLHRFARFRFVRKLYSLIQNQRQRFNSAVFENQNGAGNSDLFNEFNVNECAQKIHKTGVCFGLHLPIELVDEIYEYAQNSFCTEPGFNDKFLIHEVQEGCLRQGRPVVRALVNNPAECPAIEKVVADPILLQIVREYLQYYPTRITRHLTWSVVSHLPDRGKKLYPPTTFHYDIAGFNFMTVYFYITDVEINSGAHVMIEGSHNQKPLDIVLSSGRHSDEKIYNYYGKDKEIVIEGKRGFGFVQDPSCIHKVLPPITRNRLLLQIRYS